MAAQTPEGRVKKKIDGLLSSYSEHGTYWNKPVPAGYGTPMLDYVGCHYGLFFAIEAKKPGGKPTPRQNLCIEQMREAGAVVFVIDGDTDELEKWLAATTDSHGRPKEQGAGPT